MTVVKAEKGETVESLINRFLKRCKKLKIVEGVFERSYYEKPSVVRREAKRRRKKVIERLNTERKE